MPSVALPSTRGDSIRVEVVPEGFACLVICAFPMTGILGVELPPGRARDPGAGGTPESCGFRGHAADLAREGASAAGLSARPGACQHEVAGRLT
jgi:hypothetical protein